MPRQIIDTESSRPRYVRRVALTVVVLALLLAAIVYAVVAFWPHHARVGGNTPPPRVSWQPNVVRPAASAGPSKENQCFVA